ncbi:MAG: hypothetical protein ACI9SY_000081 [Candidatus Paceibacteria bacterium]|jgi:hypothetical protein
MSAFTWIRAKVKAYRDKRVSSATVKYMFPAMLGTVLLLGASTISSVDRSYVYLSSDSRTIEVGQILTVEVGVSAHTPINAVDITVVFPPDKVEVFSVDRGQSVLTLWTEDPIIATDYVQLTGGTFRRGFVGQHEIVSIKFRALTTGQYEIRSQDITFVAGDGTGAEIASASNLANKTTLFNFDENTTSKEIEVAIASGITTDLNQDGKVTLQDISAFMGAWNKRNQLFDFNNDGKMSFKDFSIILADFFLQ